MKKSHKIMISILLIIILITINFPCVQYAKIDMDIIQNNKNVSGTKELKSMGEIIISIITTIGVVVSVIMLAVIGVKYMLGSAEEKAEYKKSMMPYIIGCVLVFSASTIANAIYNLAK